eukprot:388561_1
MSVIAGVAGVIGIIVVMSIIIYCCNGCNDICYKCCGCSCDADRDSRNKAIDKAKNKMRNKEMKRQAKEMERQEKQNRKHAQKLQKEKQKHALQLQKEREKQQQILNQMNQSHINNTPVTQMHRYHTNNTNNTNNTNKKRKKKSKKNHNSKSKHKITNTPPNNNRIKEVIDLQLKPPTDNITHIEQPTTPITIHSPIKLHHYDADISDSDHHNYDNLSPLHQPTKIFTYNTKATPNNISRNKTPKMQILRSAKISHRDTPTSPTPISPIPILSRTKSNSISHLSPGFDNHHKPSLISQHQLSPLPILHRASSEPIYTSHSHTSPVTPPTSILRSSSPVYPIKRYSSQSQSQSQSQSGTGTDTDNEHSSDGHVSFGEVEVHEFKLLAGSESDGVPDDGGLSLHMEQKEMCNNKLNIDIYEKQRYERWKQRAQYLHWNKQKLNKVMKYPEKYLFTAGRCDAFYSSLTVKEREKRLCINKQWKRQHCDELNAERKELNEIRKSRRSNNIFCNCKPLKAMSTNELKIIARQYGIKVYENRKVKKGFLINQLKSKVLNYRDICCWDRISCTCVAAQIDCHSGTQEKHFQCGCVKYHKKCKNEYGRYVYKQPYYCKGLIDEWNEFYHHGDYYNGNEKDMDSTRSVSFKL